jgi:hypothetical protein
MRREVELVVISDVHLGTYGSRAEELVKYLRSIKPKTLVLNGDIIDIWQFNKRYFPGSHMQVIREITSFLSQGTMVYYVTGNHDEMLRKFTGFKIANFEIVNKIVLNLPTGRAWIFHGDVFDTTMRHSKWLAKLGGKGYDLLIMINTLMNWVSEKFGKGRISLSKKIKNSVKGVVSFVSNFEITAAELAIANGFDYVVCGHIHQPEIKEIQNKDGEKVQYLNSGDWVENSTALEYNEGKWALHYEQQSKASSNKNEILETHKEALSFDVLLAEITQNFAKV